MAIKLKKILFRTGIIIVMAVLTFYVYLKYQQHKSYQTLIHKSANAVVRVDMYALYQSMLYEYFGRKKSHRKPTFEGIVVPANIFIFSVKDKNPTTFFTSFLLDDAVAFDVSLKNQKRFGAAKMLHDRISLCHSKDQHWTIAYNENKAVISFSANKENVQEVLLDMLQGKNTIEVGLSPFKEIAGPQSHITYLSAQGKGSLQFNKGNMALHASLAGTGLQTGESTTHQQLDKDNALQLWFYADMQPWLAGKSFILDAITVSGDSLLASQPKGIELTLGKPVVQKDSVVTYEYNDDFEKVAQVSIKETKVPGLSLLVHAHAAELRAYLQRQNIINIDSGTVNRKVFPLYQLYTKEGNGYLQWRTLKGNVPAQGKQSSNEFFGLHINFPLLQQQEELALFKKYLEPFETMKVNATKADKQSITLEVMLQFKNKDRQALWQLLEMI